MCIRDRYYSDETNWGCYAFETTDMIPYCQKITRYDDQFNEDKSLDNFVGTLAGKMQELCIGAEYKITATYKKDSRYGDQYVPKTIYALLPQTLEAVSYTHLDDKKSI